jgi:hypothetical protein
MLTPGEFVIKRPMVNKFGAKLFEQLNNGRFPAFGNNKPMMNKPMFNKPMFGGKPGFLNKPMMNKPMFGPKLGMPTTKDIKLGESKTPSMLSSNPVYNNMYTVSVNVKSDSNPDTIAQAVIGQIRQIDSRQIRGNRF